MSNIEFLSFFLDELRLPIREGDELFELVEVVEFFRPPFESRPPIIVIVRLFPLLREGRWVSGASCMVHGGLRGR